MGDCAFDSTPLTTNHALGGNQAGPNGVRRCGAASSSTVGWGGEPDRAIDGNADGSWGSGSCTHTDDPGSEIAGTHWWQVDLGASFAVQSVNIYHRTDCCQTRLMLADVIVSTSADYTTTGTTCGAVDDHLGQPDVTVCGGISGQYVTVERLNMVITICELEVMATVAGPNYDFCFGAYSTDTVRQDFETGSAALPDGWTAVDDDPISEPGNWYVVDNTGPALANDGWAAYEASNIWGNYPGDNQLTGSYLMNGDSYDTFIAEFEVFSDDNDGLGFLFGYQGINEHFTATEINDQWPNPPADGYSGPHMKLRQRNGAALPTMNADNTVYSLLESNDGDDGVSVAKQNYVPYRGSTVMNMALKVDCCDAAGNTFITFLSSRHSSSGEVEGVQRLTGMTSAYTPGRIGLFVYAHTAKFDNFQITPLNGAELGYCEGAGECNMGDGTCACSLEGTAETMPDCSRGITAAGDVVRAPATVSGGGGGGSNSDNAVVTTLSSSAAGMTTYRLHAVLSAEQSNVYALAGTPDQNLVMPAAFQVAAPFGADVGGTSPAFIPVNADSEFDSWLTVGVVDGSAGAAISTIGLGLDGWPVDAGISADNGAVFWMDPAAAPGGEDPICLAQVTVPAGSAVAAAGLLQGKSVSGADWSAPISWGTGDSGGGGGSSDGVVQISTGAAGTTVQLQVELDLLQSNVYAMAGTSDTTMTFPAAYQVAAPFGADIGGVAPAFFAVNADAEFDSWLTIGVVDGSAGAAISASPGLGLDGWTDSAAFSTDNGAVFWMNPADGPSGTVALAQITNTDGGEAAAVLQGRSSSGADYQVAVSWSW